MGFSSFCFKFTFYRENSNVMIEKPCQMKLQLDLQNQFEFTAKTLS